MDDGESHASLYHLAPMRRTLQSVIALATFLGLAQGSALDAQGQGELCPTGTSIIPYWQGEYPGPVVDIQTNVVVQVSEDECSPPTRSCQLPPGLLHPWAPAYALEFKTVVAVQKYRATRLIRLDTWGEPAVVKPDEVVEITGYLGEGNCEIRMPDGTSVEGWCPGDPSEGWVEVDAISFAERQLARVPCQGGQPGWLVVDRSLFGKQQIAEGEIHGWGSVGPEGSRMDSGF